MPIVGAASAFAKHYHPQAVLLQALEKLLGRGVEEPGPSSLLEENRKLLSASILVVVEEVMKHRRPATGRLGLIAAMGPGFCSDLL
jgi:alkylresorcinol/alkylpyrone synthase